MTKEEYKKLIEDEAPEINIPDEFIREWIDKIADTMNVIVDGSYELHMGNLNEKRRIYDYSIEPCMPNSFKEYHIYCGIDKLAEVCGEQLLKITNYDRDYPVKCYFYYKGIKFFELRKAKDNDKGAAECNGSIRSGE